MKSYGSQSNPENQLPLEYIDDHIHSDIIYDDQNQTYVCNKCGLVLEGSSPQVSQFERTESYGRNQGETQNEWQDRETVLVGSYMLSEDITKLASTQTELFQRLYRAHLISIASYRQDRRRSEFTRFYERITKYPEFQEAFPSETKISLLLSKFNTQLTTYAEQQGSNKLQNSTKKRIFMAILQPYMNSKVFREMCKRVGEVKPKEVYLITKKLDSADYRSINVQRKQDFADQAKNLVRKAAIDPTIKQLAEDLITKRAHANGLILRKRPHIFAAAALFVAASQGQTKPQISKNKARKLVGASYLPKDAIMDIQQVVNTPNTGNHSEKQKLLIDTLKKRERLLQLRQALRTQLDELVQEAFPELAQILNLRNKSTIELLKNYPTTTSIANLKPNELSTFLRIHSQGNLRNIDSLTTRLLTAAQQNELIGRRRPRPGNHHVIHDVICDLEKVNRQRYEMEQEMKHVIGSEGLVLMRTPGIGLIAATIMICSRNTQIAPRIPTQSFLQRRLQDAIRIMTRNHELKTQYKSWFDQKLPQMQIVQNLTNQLLDQMMPLHV